MRSFRAPGRVNLIGEHVDYLGGLVLPVAIDREVRLDCSPGGELVSLTSEKRPGSVELAAGGGGRGSGWGRYAAAVIDELGALGRPPVGLTGRLTASLPAGAGLSSSAALEVVLATALCAVADWPLSPLELAQACSRAERRAVGVPSGVMDQAASVLGAAGHCLLLDCGTLEYRYVPLPPELELVVVDSGVARSLERSPYAQRRDELERAVAAETADLDPLLTRRLRHVVGENARVRATVELLSAPELDRDALGAVFAAGHASLRDDLEVSLPELDLLVRLAREAGAVAARLTGGGFGGAIVAFVERSHAESFGSEVAVEYDRRTGNRATVHRCVAVDGANEVSAPPAA